MTKQSLDYKQEFEGIIYPFLVNKYSMLAEDYQKELTKVTELVYNRFRRSIYKEAKVRVARMYNVDRADFVDSCVGACVVSIMRALKEGYPAAIGQFTMYIRRVITTAITQELTMQFQQVHALDNVGIELLPSPSLCVCGDAGGEKFDLYLELRDRIKLLSEEDQKLLHDHFMLDKSFQEMQDEYGVTRQAVGLRYLNTLKRLKAMFTTKDFEALKQSYMEVE